MTTSKNMREAHRLTLLRGADARHQPMAMAQFDAIRVLILTEAVAQAFENTKALQAEGFQVTFSDIAGAGFEPATFGL